MYDDEKSILFTIFHEMIHFIFYDYCQKQYLEYFKNLDTETGIFWEIAEIFNATIQATKPFQDLHGAKKLSDYPELKDKLKQSKKYWKGDIDDWINNFAINLIIKYRG